MAKQIKIGTLVSLDNEQEIRALATQNAGNFIQVNALYPAKEYGRFLRRLFPRKGNTVLASTIIPASPELLYLMAKIVYDQEFDETYFTDGIAYITKQKATKLNEVLKETLIRVFKRAVEIDDESLMDVYQTEVKGNIESMFDKSKIYNKVLVALSKEEAVNHYTTKSNDGLTRTHLMYTVDVQKNLTIRYAEDMYFKSEDFKVEKLNKLNTVLFTKKEMEKILDHFGVIEMLNDALTTWERGYMFSEKEEIRK